MNPPPPTQPPPPHPTPPTAAFLPPYQPNPPPPPASLPSALSSLSSLLHLSSTTLHSLPTPIPSAAASPAFLPCPYNPNHRLPPSSLFHHYLNCPSSVSLQHNYHYPLTVHSLSTRSAVDLSSLPITTSDISVPLENYVAYNAPANSIFYQGCPGPVTPSIRPPPLLNLPWVLYVECADFNKDPSEKEVRVSSVNLIRFLPSEIWAIRSETEAWGGGFPAAYSSRILRAILRLRDCKLLHLYEWIVASSPRYGVIIDFAMRDHMVLLVRLCLKVIVREAFGFAGFMFSDGELEMEEHTFLGLSNRNFECPVLVKVMMWLALQFSILYGEVNGRFLAVDVFKECILDSASQASLFPLEQKGVESNDVGKVDVEVEEQIQSILSIDDIDRDERGNIKAETVVDSMIFVSQVAASVAALHERLFIEEKIKALRSSKPLAYQRNLEHAHVSKIADEERLKRPEYRPIIEHDGFLWQRSNNQETNKAKTREELLAEERDYKRRRMSYRGKKSKRNTLEVMRDIIDEYMEEIKQAGGIGDMSKTVEETESLASEILNTQSAAGVSGSRRKSEIPEENRSKLVDYRKELQSHHGSEDLEDDIQRPRRDSSWDHGRQDRKHFFENRDDYSGGPGGRQNSSHSRQHMNGTKKDDYAVAFAGDYSRRSHQRRSKSNERKYHNRNRDEHEQNNRKKERDEHERTRSKRERCEDNQEHGNRRRKMDSSHRGRDENSGVYEEGKRKSRTNRHSRPLNEDEFEDRYDPAVSHDSS